MTARVASSAHVVAGASLPNTTGREHQDRYSCGQDERGAWLVVADGVSLGDHGALSAATAVHVAVTTLIGGTLDADGVGEAVRRAHAAVRALLGATGRGGTTLSVATLVDDVLHVAVVGDSPVYVSHERDLTQLTPESYGPLRHWLGQPAPLCPWVRTVRIPLGACVLVCSDGAAPEARCALHLDPQRWVAQTLARRRSSDDATVVAAATRPLGARSARTPSFPTGGARWAPGPTGPRTGNRFGRTSECSAQGLAHRPGPVISKGDQVNDRRVTVRRIGESHLREVQVGRLLTFGRGDTTKGPPVDLVIGDHTSLSRRAGSIAAEHGGVRITCTQLRFAGGVEVLAPGGVAVARLVDGEDVLRRELALIVRVVGTGAATEDLEVRQILPLTRAELERQDEPYVTEPVWSADDILCPDHANRWKRVLAIACAHTRFPRGLVGAVDLSDENVPGTDWMRRRCQWLFDQQQITPRWLTDRLDEALHHYRLPIDGTDKLRRLVPRVLGLRVIDEELLLRVAEEIQRAEAGGWR